MVMLNIDELYDLKNKLEDFMNTKEEDGYEWELISDVLDLVNEDIDTLEE